MQVKSGLRCLQQIIEEQGANLSEQTVNKAHFKGGKVQEELTKHVT